VSILSVVQSDTVTPVESAPAVAEDVVVDVAEDVVVVDVVQVL
jgi:hypothetical protein